VKIQKSACLSFIVWPFESLYQLFSKSWRPLLDIVSVGTGMFQCAVVVAATSTPA
jgi:hypothetical protein